MVAIYSDASTSRKFDRGRLCIGEIDKYSAARYTVFVLIFQRGQTSIPSQKSMLLGGVSQRDNGLRLFMHKRGGCHSMRGL